MASITEANSPYSSLDQLSTSALLSVINTEDQTVPLAVSRAIPQLEKLVDATFSSLTNGGRLFYLGAGTSGRLGIVDASECPPTFGVPHGLVNGLIAGGDSAIRKAVENAEDNLEGAQEELKKFSVSPLDIVVGIAASGRTPYVVGGLKWCRSRGIKTGCIVCNSGSLVADQADYPVEVIVGPEVITGSTRMKAGTAQKLVLNMLTTATMVKLGKVRGNRMTHMQLSNEKLRQRAVTMLSDLGNISKEEATHLMEKYNSVEEALQFLEGTRKNR